MESAGLQVTDDWNPDEMEKVCWLSKALETPLERLPVYPGKLASFKLWLPLSNIKGYCQHALMNIESYALQHGLEPQDVARDADLLAQLAPEWSPQRRADALLVYEPRETPAVHRRGTMRWYELPGAIASQRGFCMRWLCAGVCEILFATDRSTALSPEASEGTAATYHRLPPAWRPPDWSVEADV